VGADVSEKYTGPRADALKMETEEPHHEDNIGQDYRIRINFGDFSKLWQKNLLNHSR
jgi:hypothetical protein